MFRVTTVVVLCILSVCVAKMSYKVTELSEEENTAFGSRFLTESQKCDGCSAVAYQFHQGFELKHKNRPHSLGDMPIHEVIEVLGKIFSVLRPTMLWLLIVTHKNLEL